MKYFKWCHEEYWILVSAYKWPLAFTTYSVLVRVNNHVTDIHPVSSGLLYEIYLQGSKLCGAWYKDQNSFRSRLLGFLSCHYHQPGMGNRTNCKHSTQDCDSLTKGDRTFAGVVFSEAWTMAAGHGQNSPAGQPYWWWVPTSSTHHGLECCSFSEISPSDFPQFCDLGKDFE